MLLRHLGTSERVHKIRRMFLWSCGVLFRSLGPFYFLLDLAPGSRPRITQRAYGKMEAIMG